MVTTGFSRIHVAKYAERAGVVEYSEVREIARARSMETDITTTDNNDYYANNQLAEQEPAAFSSGSASITVDGLSAEEEAFILGIESETRTINGKEVELIPYGTDMNPPYVGIGAVKRQQLKGVVSYRAVIFTKARFAIPSEAAETQEGDGLTWQDQDLSATLMPDDSGNRRWKYIPKTNFTTEEDAVNFIRGFLGGAANAS